MSAEAKPVDVPVAAAPAVAPVTEVIPLTEPVVPVEEKPVTSTAAAPTTEEVKPLDPVSAAAAPVETAKKSEEKIVEPVSEGNLVYKAPAKFPKNLVPGREHRYFFYIGDAAVPAEKLSTFTSTVKADYTHDAAAWSSQTGKGLLYYSKTKEDKESPVGVLPLSEVTDIKESGLFEFTFKIAEHKHVFIASSAVERAGWVAAIKPEVESAVSKKDEIHASEGFKSQLETLKPAVVAASVPTKKSTEAERAPREETTSTKDKAKSRSVSRGKGIFDRFGKKEAAKEDVKKEESVATESAPVVTDAPVVEPVAPIEPVETAPVAASTEAAPVVAAAPLAIIPLTETPKEETSKVEEPAAPKNNRRASKFGDFFKKVTSPTQEKKESEIVPAVAGVESTEAKTSMEASTLDAPPPVITASTIPAPEVAPVAEPETTAAPVAPAAEGVTPGKEKKKFGLPNLFEKKAKTTSTDAPTTETTTEAPVVADIEAPKATDSAIVDGETAKTPSDPKEKRRSSFFFGDLGGSIKKPAKEKKATETTPAAEPVVVAEPVTEVPAVEETKSVETPEAVKAEETKTSEPKKEKDDLKNKVVGLGRRFSTAIRGNKEKKSTTTPAKVDETAEEKAISSEAPKIEEPKLESSVPAEPTTKPSSEPRTIGDVVPEAVTVGTPSAPAAAPVVSATA